MWHEGKYFFIAPENYCEKTIRKKWKENTPNYLLKLLQNLKNLQSFDSQKIEGEFQKVLDENSLGMGNLLPAFRLALTGIGMGPSLFNIAEIIGKQETINRLENAIQNIR